LSAGKGASAETDGADRAHGVLVGDGNIGAVGFFVDGHFWNQRDSHARTHHAEQTAELTAFENNFGMKPRAVARGNGIFAKAVAIPKQQERFGTKILQ
jgi:hypothetical protein